MNSNWLTAAPGSTNLWNNLRNVNLTLCCSFSLVLINSVTVTGTFKCWQQVRMCQPSENWIWWFRQKMLTAVGSATYQRSYRCWLSLSCGLADVPDVLLEEPHFHMSYNYAVVFFVFFFDAASWLSQVPLVMCVCNESGWCLIWLGNLSQFGQLCSLFQCINTSGRRAQEVFFKRAEGVAVKREHLAA